jgi:hypothetical protein
MCLPFSVVLPFDLESLDMDIAGLPEKPIPAIVFTSKAGRSPKLEPHVDLMAPDLTSGFVTNRLKVPLFDTGNPTITISLFSDLIAVGN